MLSALYFAQGLPFGFQSNALALYLTELGLSMKQVSFARLLALPWMLKALWAPLVDRFGNERFGRRKSWIVPMQVLLAATCLGAAFVPPADHLALLLVLVMVMNLFAATQDIAVDGLAVDLLEERELGAGNAAQVVGYKVGMLTGGGLLVGLSAYFGWRGIFFSMAGLCLLVMTVVLFVREPPPHGETGERPPALTFREFLAKAKEILSRKGTGWFLLAVFTYKVGESMADAMFGPWLVKAHGIEKETVALWLGSWGVIASLAGSFAGGVLATRTRLVRAVTIAAVLRVLPLVAQWAMVAGFIAPGADTVVPITMLEHFFGGVLTTAMFALMMSQVDRRIGATHYTVLASIEVIGKSPAALLSGVFVDALGFAPVFLGAAVLSAAYVLVLVPLNHAKNPAEIRAGL